MVINKVVVNKESILLHNKDDKRQNINELSLIYSQRQLIFYLEVVVIIALPVDHNNHNSLNGLPINMSHRNN